MFLPLPCNLSSLVIPDIQHVVSDQSEPRSHSRERRTPTLVKEDHEDSLSSI